VTGYADRVAVWGEGRVVKICDPTTLLNDDVVIETVTGSL
jgi:ABC-type branched-subunit amino acid transport system ATPase component